MLKLIDFLKVFDGSGLNVSICAGNEDEPLWVGHYDDIPWWIIKNANLNFGALDSSGDEAVEFRENVNGRPGIVIIIE